MLPLATGSQVRGFGDPSRRRSAASSVSSRPSVRSTTSAASSATQRQPLGFARRNARRRVDHGVLHRQWPWGAATRATSRGLTRRHCRRRANRAGSLRQYTAGWQYTDDASKAAFEAYLQTLARSRSKSSSWLGTEFLAYEEATCWSGSAVLRLDALRNSLAGDRAARSSALMASAHRCAATSIARSSLRRATTNVAWRCARAVLARGTARVRRKRRRVHHPLAHSIGPGQIGQRCPAARLWRRNDARRRRSARPALNLPRAGRREGIAAGRSADGLRARPRRACSAMGRWLFATATFNPTIGTSPA